MTWSRLCALLWLIHTCFACNEDTAIGSQPFPESDATPARQADAAMVDESLPDAAPRDAMLPTPAIPDGGTWSPTQGDGGMNDGAMAWDGQGLPPLPKLPVSDTRIVGRVLNTEGADLWGAAVRAGGPATVADEYGGFELLEVRGDRTTRIMAQARGHAPTEFLLPLEFGDSLSVPMVLKPLDHNPTLPDLGSGEVLLGDRAAMTLAPDSLVQPWGSVARRSVTFEFALFGTVEREWLALPGDGALSDGRLLHVETAFYLGAHQGGTRLSLASPATLRLTLHPDSTPPGMDAGVAPPPPPQTLTLYRYAPATGHFEAVRDVTAVGGVVTLELTELGTYAFGEPMASQGCARVAIAPTSPPADTVAVLRNAGDGHGGMALADADGTACLRGIQGANQIEVYQRSGARRFMTGLQSVQLPAALSSTVTCADDCADAGQVTLTPRAIGCVTGTLFGPREERATLRFAGSDQQYTRQAAGSAPFCYMMPAGTLDVYAFFPQLDCGPTEHLVVEAGTACGDGTCADLGERRCCGDYERCETVGYDDDCDDIVDEGCRCGIDTCDTQPRRRGCCTDDDLCGIEGVAEDSCFEYLAPGEPASPACADENVTFEDYTLFYSGCCRADGRCGFEDIYYGCVAREELHEAVPALATYSAIDCTP